MNQFDEEEEDDIVSVEEEEEGDNNNNNNHNSPPFTPPSSSANSVGSASYDSSDEDALLLDVNDTLRTIVAASSSAAAAKSPDTGATETAAAAATGATDGMATAATTALPPSTAVAVSATLNERQLKQIRKLQPRIRRLLNLHQRGFRKVVTGNADKRVRDHAKDNFQKTRTKLKKGVRKVVTGDAEKPLRLFFKEAKVVKNIDKFSFCLGITMLCVTEYMVLERPQNFGFFYVAVVAYLVLLRLYLYSKMQMFYFLLDFCYLVNASCFVSVLFQRDNARLWRMNFALSNGTLLGALLAWRNSLVFHSLDKVTSITIHFLPGLLCFVQRWSPEGRTMFCEDNNNIDECRIGWQGGMFDPLLCYASWQGLYILKTEFFDRQHMLNNPDIKTSLRWLARDTKNGMHRLARKVCRAVGILDRTEQFDAESLKTKLVFWTMQFLFTIVTLLPTFFLFCNQTLHISYIIFVMSAAVYNGANYYFEVFAARYVQQVEAKHLQAAAAAAASVASTDEIAPAQNPPETPPSNGTKVSSKIE